MGIDKLHCYRKRQSARRNPASRDPYLRLLVQLYRFLARRTTSAFNREILKRLVKSRVNKPVVSTSRLALLGAKGDQIIVAVGTVVDDSRMLDLPKMSVVALRFTATAAARILKAGGECLTFDQLAMRRPTGARTLLVRGARNARESCSHFGRPAGTPGSHTKPRVPVKTAMGKKHEQARGRRSGCGFRV
eukprot:m51a1_g14853 putative 60S ribosomal protein L18e (190) ;mRNA; r:552427-553228